MINNQFSAKLSEIIAYSKEEAIRLQNAAVAPEHLLLGILREGECKAVRMLQQLNADLKTLRFELETAARSAANIEAVAADTILLDEKSSRILKLCLLEARLFKSTTADSEHVLLAIMKDKENKACSTLEEMQITYNDLLNAMSQKSDIKLGFGVQNDDAEDDDYYDDEEDMTNKTSKNSSEPVQPLTTIKKGNRNTPILDSFGIDLTQAAADGVLDPVIGRENEIMRVSQILSRRKKNNPILIGEPGVGKSAIVEGLALRIVQRKVSRILFNKRIISLDLTAVVAGTKYRGQFEERIRGILNELQKNPDIILFIDEIHTIIGAGSAPGSMDAANILKPALARGEIQCIGATTTDEYRKSIEKDGALERRFQKVMVEPTTPEETLLILQNIKDRYEKHHHVTYTPEALEACVKFTERYISDRYFPDKAIDAMDEAGARAHISNLPVSKEIEEQEQKIEELHQLKNNAVKEQNFELAADYRDQESKLQQELETMKAEWTKELDKNRITVDEHTIADIVAMITGIPVQRIGQSETSRLKHMAQVLKEQIIGQDQAVDTIVRSIQRSRVGLKDPKKPIGTFLFVGPTGVGKTHLAKKLAEEIFGSEDALIRIDMSEYAEKHTVSRMIGAPPGYIGHDEGGQLTEKVRRKPYSILLLDELEKAHSDVFNILLQVMDEGRMTDGNGNTIDFKNTVIIMTSNCGTRQLKDFGNAIGYSSGVSTEIDKTLSKSLIMKSLNRLFAPEFLNRLDEIINFEQLDQENIRHIVDIELRPILKRIEELGYQLELDDSAKQFLAQKGYDVQYGARPLKRALQTYLEDAICEQIINENVHPGETIYATLENEQADKLSFNKNPKQE